MAPTRPSIMSLGDTTSAPASACQKAPRQRLGEPAEGGALKYFQMVRLNAQPTNQDPFAKPCQCRDQRGPKCHVSSRASLLPVCFEHLLGQFGNKHVNNARRHLATRVLRPIYEGAYPLKAFWQISGRERFPESRCHLWSQRIDSEGFERRKTHLHHCLLRQLVDSFVVQDLACRKEHRSASSS